MNDSKNYRACWRILPLCSKGLIYTHRYLYNRRLPLGPIPEIRNLHHNGIQTQAYLSKKWNNSVRKRQINGPELNSSTVVRFATLWQGVIEGPFNFAQPL